MLSSAKMSANLQGLDKECEDWQEVCSDVNSDQSYTDNLTYIAANRMKNTFIWYVGVVGGCFSVAACVPKALPYVTAYIVPSAAVPGVMATTTASSVAALTYAVGNKITTEGAEATLSMFGSGLTYLYKSVASAPKEMANGHHELYKLKG